MGESWPDTKRESLDALHRVGVQLAAATDLAELKERLVDSIIQLVGAKKAALIELTGPAGDWGDVTFRAADEGATTAEFSEEDRYLIADVIAESRTTGRRAVNGNLSDDVPPDTIQLRTMMVAPLRSRNEISGVLYAENPVSGFDDADLKLFETLALLAASNIDTLRLHEALLAADRETGEYISLVTHQVRIPLTSVAGYTDLLLSNMAGSLSGQQMDFLNRIKRNVDRMNVLVRDLSDINRLESGRMKLELATFDVNETITSAAESLRETFESRQQDLLVDSGAGAPAVCADRSAVRRTLRIILDNASRYTPQGGKISLCVEHDDHFARVEVSDSGIGISEADQSDLFTPFFRSDDSAVREVVGWGLGLVVARRLVEAQRGQVTCTSELGKGSTFAFTVPLAGAGNC